MTSIMICGTGRHGLAFARVLSSWCEQVLPRVEVRISPPEASASGWPDAVIESTRGIDAALVCVFKSDVRSSQLHFQLGACFRSLGLQRPLAPVLVDMDAKDVAQTPFELFQCASCREHDLRKLVTRLSAALLPTVNAAKTSKRFAKSWSELQRAIDSVPGPGVRPFEITLALPGVTKTFPYSAGLSDGEWSATAGPMIAALPQLGLPEFDASQLRYLDLARQEWIRPPYWLSRICTSRLGLIHADLLTEWSTNPKEVTRHVKLALEGEPRGPTISVAGTLAGSPNSQQETAPEGPP